MRAKECEHLKKEALYEQKIQLLEMEMKDLDERQANMKRINEKLMTILGQQDSKSKSVASSGSKR